MATEGQHDLQCSLHIPKVIAGDAERLIHEVISKVCGQKGPSYEDYSSLFTLEEWITAQKELSSLVSRVAGHNLAKEKVLQSLESTGVGTDVSHALVDAIQLRGDEIRRSLVSQTSGISQVVLNDFDWKVKLILSSDKMGSLREAVANVDLDLKTEEGRRMFSLEMNKEELDLLIGKLEAANKETSVELPEAGSCYDANLTPMLQEQEVVQQLRS